MSARWVDEMISKTAPLLSKWQGGRVKFWDYTPTHTKLTLRIESRGLAGNLHVVCGDCSYMRGPFSWRGCDLRILRGNEGDGIILADEEAGFELRCTIVSVEENVDPVYRVNTGAE